MWHWFYKLPLHFSNMHSKVFSWYIWTWKNASKKLFSLNKDSQPCCNLFTLLPLKFYFMKQNLLYPFSTHKKLLLQTVLVFRFLYIILYELQKCSLNSWVVQVKKTCTIRVSHDSASLNRNCQNHGIYFCLTLQEEWGTQKSTYNL